MAENLRIVVVGAGAIGGITAAALQESGYAVRLVCRHEETAALASGEGLLISGTGGERRVPVSAVAQIEQLQGTFDAALIATKAYDLPDAARRLLPFLREDSLAVSLQNGICTDALAAVVGAGRTVGCVVGWGATMHGPGRLEMTSTGDFVIGRLDGRTDGLESVRQAMESVVPARLSPDIYAELYSKLIVNACITSLGALCGLTLGQMLRSRRARDIFICVIREAVAAAEASGLTIPAYGGKLDYHRFVRGNGALDTLRRHGMIGLIGLKYRKLKSSSLQSLERGRPTEIDYFNGYLLKKAEENGGVAPVNARLTEMVHEIERGERRISAENFFDPALAAAVGYNERYGANKNM